MKKVLSTLLALCLLAVCLPIGASAEITGSFFCPGGGYLDVDPANVVEYKTPGGTVGFDKSTGSIVGISEDYTGELVIPETIEGVTVQAVESVVWMYDEKAHGGVVSGISRLTSVTIPATVTKIADGAFHNWKEYIQGELEEVVVDPANPVYSSVDGILYNKEQTVLLQCPGGKKTADKIPGTVTRIEAAFYQCFVTSVTIPESVTSIADNAFYSWAGEGLTLHVAPGGYAETYAKENNIPFVANGRPVDPPVPDNPTRFTDVPAGSYYENPVKWAVENNITAGTDKTHFSPNQPCTRAQAVTFLWRAANKPEPTSTDNPFVDVAPDAYYYKAVLWAVERGVTKGTDSAHFSPNDTCTRAQIVTFLYSAEGKPEASGGSFGDVADTAYYAKPVQWAVANGITAGTDKTHFSPADNCVRAQIVTFLYRNYVK